MSQRYAENLSGLKLSVPLVSSGNSSTPGFFSWLGNAVKNLFNQKTGSAMTDAEREALALEQRFNAEQATLAYNRQMQADNTKMQRAVADYKAAGLNPYGLAGGTLSAPSVSSASSSAPSVGPVANLGALLELFSLPAKIRSLNASAEASEAAAVKSSADAAKSRVEASKVEEDTRGAKLQNDFFEKMRDVREQAERLENDLKSGEKRRIYKDIDRMESEITRNIEQAHSEQEKQGLIVQQKLLANAEAENLTAMRPYIQAELSARTSLERQQTRVAAVDEAYRQRLIDSGTIEAAVRLTKAQASETEVASEVKEAENWLKNYDIHRKAGDLHAWLSDGESSLLEAKIVDALYSGLTAVSASVLGK